MSSMEDEWNLFLSSNPSLLQDECLTGFAKPSIIMPLNMGKQKETGKLFVNKNGRYKSNKTLEETDSYSEDEDEDDDYEDAKDSYDGGTNINNESMSYITKEIENVRVSAPPAKVLKKKDTITVRSLKQKMDTIDKPVSRIDTEQLYISTNTKVLYLNREINILDIFWKLPITEYWRPMECIIKKQMKIVSKTPEEYELLVEKLKTIPYYTEKIIKQINNPNARRIKFKDERKITVGVSKKDIMNCRGKAKDAFYNCFAMIVRFMDLDEWKEIHVKVFNTGKLEIPGILNSTILDSVKRMVVDILQPYMDEPLGYLNKEENVLINSNFNCGFFINQMKLHNILKSEKYRLCTTYDPCIYPGIKCKYYYNNTLPKESQTGRVLEEDQMDKVGELLQKKKYTEVSLMIFRTGSGLIVGNCSETILRFIYEFIKGILFAEKEEIMVETDESVIKQKKIKIRKKNISISSNYCNTVGI